MHPFRHLATVCHHRRLVRRHCFRAGIPWQGLIHDLSKFSPTEFWQGARYWQGTFSPTEEERRVKGYSIAWMHHKGRNRHHFEFWTDINPATHTYESKEMPLPYVAEMLCDRMAASKTYLGKAYTDSAPYDYFIAKHARNLMHPATATLLHDWLLLLKEEGEDAVFRTVKAAVRAYRKDIRGAKKRQ